MALKNILFYLVICFIKTSNLFSQHTGFTGMLGLRNYTFTSMDKKVLPGKSKEKGENGTIQSADIIGNLGLVSLYYHNSCYTDGQYNNNDFTVEKGEITDNSGNLKFEAYRVYEPTHKAKNFLASEHNIYYRFASKQDYTVYRFDDNNLKKIADIPANNISSENFTKIENLTVSKIKGNSTFVFIPKNVKVSADNNINETVEAAKVNQTVIGDIYKIRYTVKGSLFDNVSNYNNKTRHYFCANLVGEKTGIVWQDESDFSLHFTTIYQNLVKNLTIELPNSNKGVLAAATANSKGDIFYFTIFQQEGNPVNAVISKTNSITGINITNKLDASKQLNMFAYGNETASMEISGDKVLLMIARTMNKSNDGLNHQGGIAVSFDINNLNLLKNYGQTSGHSFDNYLSVSSTGDFIGIDLGDNYPRGINLHRINEVKNSKVVYTFKTQHGESADCWGIKTFPLYPEISTSTKKYYKWSNDNNTYTELGAVIETDDGFMVSFLGEPDKNGNALNNNEVETECSRNVGFVIVKKDFYNGSEDIFLSRGISETGGFFTFSGRWSEQKNTGLVWLTKYANPALETAKNMKTIKLNDGNLLFLWEKWGENNYKKTLALKTSQDGKPIGNIVELGSQVRLDRRDDLLVKGNQVIIMSGNKNEQKLELCIIDLKN